MSNDKMNRLLLGMAGREEGDGPKKQNPSLMNRYVLDRIPKSYDLFKKINIFKRDD